MGRARKKEGKGKKKEIRRAKADRRTGETQAGKGEAISRMANTKEKTGGGKKKE